MTGLTYVLTHPGFRAVKVGYTTTKSRRLEYFIRRGWQPYRMLFLATHAMARDVEQATLFELRFRLHVPPYLTETDMNYGGWSETSSVGLIRPEDVWGVVCEQGAVAFLSPTIGRAPDGRRFNGGTPPRRVAGDTVAYSAIAKKQAALEQTSAVRPASSEEQS
ncbi:hypothetical protein [Streptomyces sp. NBC_01353]|uniref:hypothetical protein n=1 Tax=Streptomyces sp. NBC_01353 TaxID=2903835 RepID=UPI002E361B44|nr:hypothetical protein [Streptomyces sp. NBC_01353]